MKNQLTIKSETWFNQLCDDFKSIIVERGFRSRLEIVEGKWELGERLASDKDYKKYAKGSGEVIKELASEIKMSESDIYDCVKFYEKYKGGVSTGVGNIGKNLSWRKVKIELLGRKDDKTGRELICYKIEWILEAFKKWFEKSKTTVIDEAIEEFKKLLIKLRK